MICLVIRGPSQHDVRRQLEKAVQEADLVELNLDKWHSWSLEQLKELKTRYSIPMLFTLRQKAQGGDYSHSEEQRLVDLLALASISPDYLDIEDTVPKEFIETLWAKYPHLKIILSHHDFEKTPTDLSALLKKMKEKPATLYKIAVHANSASDAMRMLTFLKNHDQVIGVSMGEFGEATRIACKLYGGKITFATVEEGLTTAPGQILGSVLKKNYNFSSLSNNTGLFGLIGNPVSKSLSHITHNHAMRSMKLDGLYVKTLVHPNDLSSFIPYLKSLGWKGISVTMPHKETIIPLLDEIDPIAKAIGAVNTLVFKNGQCHGYNTDGIGALRAIEEKVSVKGKRVVMIGAGGAAKAVVFMLHQKGAHVTILNRDKERAVKLAEQIGCQGDSLEGIEKVFHHGYDLIINSTPVEMPIESKWILPGAFAMDLKSLPKETEFLKQAGMKGCTTIYGISMFYHQAVEQFRLWFGDKVAGDEDTVLKHLQEVGDSLM